MADTPAWVQLTVPVVAAAATWVTTRLDFGSLGRVKQFGGLWYAYYRDPDTRKCEAELWEFSSLGAVSVSRNGRCTFKGRLSLKGNKAYMNVKSTISSDERLFVMLDTPSNPRNGDFRPSVCIWLGKSADHTTTAGHGLLSRERIDNPVIKDEFLRAEVRPTGC